LSRGELILSRGEWTLLRGEWILSRGEWIMLRGVWILSRGEWILLRGEWILLRGEWILLRPDFRNVFRVCPLHYVKHIGSFYFKGKQCLAANKLHIIHPIPLAERQKKEKIPSLL